ncbi:serine hydrolase domain-containing protein [soil metagenome]
MARHSVIRALLFAVAALCSSCAERNRPVVLSASEDANGFYPGTWMLIDREVHQQQLNGGICGGAIAIRRNGAPVYSCAFGRVARGEKSSPVTFDTKFDVASLTKPMAGVPAAVLLLAESDAELQSAIRRIIGHRHLLDDTAAYEHAKTLAVQAAAIADRGDRLRLIIEGLADEAQGTIDPAAYRYSNTAYFLLGCRAAFNHPHLEDDLSADFWKPLGLANTGYHPAAPIAVTGFDRDGAEVIGRPFDPLADLAITELDIPPLHSGLFATADDAAKFFDALSDPYQPSVPLRRLRALLFSQPVLLHTKDRVQLFVSAGGLESPTEPPMAGPSGAPQGAIYMQSGYTGCLLWTDLRSRTTIAVLTNASATDAEDEAGPFTARIIDRAIRGVKR